MTAHIQFPKGFAWGVATSAYQIEGTAHDDGRGMSVWDTFSHTPGKIRTGDTGDIACDHYRRFRDDVRIMSELEIPNYRFSMAWPRIIPDGQGTVNQKGIDFYDALIDEFLKQGIQPWVTLFHWDYPQSLQDRGGWLNPDSPRWLADYVSVAVEKFSDRVQNWFTINEPQCFLRFGHGDGNNAPGLRLSLAERLQAVHHVLLAHGLAVTAIRSSAKTTPRIGWAPVGVAAIPQTNTPADIAAAQYAMTDTPESLWSNTLFNDPVFLGKYPDVAWEKFGTAMPRVTKNDLETIAQPLDFVGLNIYMGAIIRADDNNGAIEVPPGPGFPRTAFDWPVVEESLYWGVKFYADRYHVPIYVTENGMANLDWVNMDGKVRDPQRVDYLARYLMQLARAVDEGLDVRGYFQWSLLDNFEWSEGYSKRFGLVHVDFQTQRRTVKESATWYRNVIRNNGFTY